MVYEIDGKFYVLASRKYKQVTIEKDSKGEYDVKVVKNAQPIEHNKNITATKVSLEDAFKRKGRNYKAEQD